MALPSCAGLMPKPSMMISAVMLIRNVPPSRVLGLQARAADQAAVDFRLRHQAVRVLGIHAAAILDAHRVRGFLAELLLHGLADHADGFVRLLVGGGEAVPMAQTGS